MSVYVVDASVAVKWFLLEVHNEAAFRLRNPSYSLHVPALFTLEFGNIVCKKIRRGEITLDEGLVMLQDTRRIPMQHHPDEALFPHAFELANQTRRSLYDCLYLALAVLLNGKLVTADRKFYDALQPGPLSKHLCWVEDLP